MDVTAWSIAEVASGILCAALPTLRPLFGLYFPSLSGTFHKFSGYQKAKDSNFSSAASKSGQNSAFDRSSLRLAMPFKGDFDIEGGSTEMDLRRYRLRDGEGALGNIPAILIPKSARIRGNPSDKRLIGGKLLQISWPVEASTSTLGVTIREGPGRRPLMVGTAVGSNRV